MSELDIFIPYAFLVFNVTKDQRKINLRNLYDLENGFGSLKCVKVMIKIR